MANKDANMQSEAKADLHQKAMTQMEAVIIEVENLIDVFNEIKESDTNLSSLERKRLTGIRLRNLGFVEAAMDIMRKYPQFMPLNFSFKNMTDKYDEFQELRHLVWLLEQLLQSVKDAELTATNSLYRYALIIYRTLQQQARAMVAGADVLFQELKRRFRTLRRSETEPTEHEIDSHYHATIKETE